MPSTVTRRRGIQSLPAKRLRIHRSGASVLPIVRSAKLQTMGMRRRGDPVAMHFVCIEFIATTWLLSLVVVRLNGYMLSDPGVRGVTLPGSSAIAVHRNEDDEGQDPDDERRA